MAKKNTTILGKFFTENTNDAQQRLTNGTQTSMKNTINNIFDPMNQMLYNSFSSWLINRIGMTKVHSSEWTNPLAVFKGEKLIWGQTIQEIAPKWIKAHSYMDDKETLLKVHRPEVEECFHSVNRQEYYPVSINREELRMAFTDTYGLDSLVSSVMSTPVNSDNYDEYEAMKELLSYYEDSWGMYKIQVPTDGTDEENAKWLLKSFQTMAKKLAFPSTLYNAGVINDIPVFEKDPSKLVLLTTPEVNASLNVDALAVLFNVDRAEVPYRIVIVDEFPIDGVQAILTTEDFFVFHDYVYDTTSFFNPETLTTNYYLHHWEVLSLSPFVPCICYTTKTGTLNATVTETFSSIELTGKQSAEPGEIVPLTVTVKGKLEADVPGVDYDNMTVAPTAATYEVSAEIPATVDEDGETVEPAEPIQLNTRTFVDRLGRLHIQKSGLKSGDVLTVTATSTYTNPSGTTPSDLTASLKITIA